MKYYKVLIVFCILLTPVYAWAQGKMVVKLSRITDKGNDIVISFTSDKKFIFGSNRYVLYVGDKTFFRSQQSYDYANHTGHLQFFVPLEDWEQLRDGSKMFISYGLADESVEDLEKLSTNEFPTCWNLGLLSRSALEK